MYDKGILSEKVAEGIRQTIISKNLSPGDKLPNELELTKELNISRSTLREAIKTLVSMNILEVRRGLGTYVAANTGISRDPLGIAFIEEENLLSHFFEVRYIVEPHMAELAVLRGSDEEHEAILDAFHQVEEAILAGRNHTKEDIAFHNAIAMSTHNPILQRIGPIINEGILGGYAKTKDLPESGKTVLAHHRKLMKAIRSRDGKRAREAMEEHIFYGLEKSRHQ